MKFIINSVLLSYWIWHHNLLQNRTSRHRARSINSFVHILIQSISEIHSNIEKGFAATAYTRNRIFFLNLSGPRAAIKYCPFFHITMRPSRNVLICFAFVVIIGIFLRVFVNIEYVVYEDCPPDSNHENGDVERKLRELYYTNYCWIYSESFISDCSCLYHVILTGIEVKTSTNATEGIGQVGGKHLQCTPTLHVTRTRPLFMQPNESHANVTK